MEAELLADAREDISRLRGGGRRAVRVWTEWLDEPETGVVRSALAAVLSLVLDGGACNGACDRLKLALECGRAAPTASGAVLEDDAEPDLEVVCATADPILAAAAAADADADDLGTDAEPILPDPEKTITSNSSSSVDSSSSEL